MEPRWDEYPRFVPKPAPLMPSICGKMWYAPWASCGAIVGVLGLTALTAMRGKGK